MLLIFIEVVRKSKDPSPLVLVEIIVLNSYSANPRIIVE